MAKVLFFLPAEKLWARVLRRGIVVAVLTFAVIVLKEAFLPLAPEVWVPVLTGIVVAIEKMIRDLMEKK